MAPRSPAGLLRSPLVRFVLFGAVIAFGVTQSIDGSLVGLQRGELAWIDEAPSRVTGPYSANFEGYTTSIGDPARALVEPELRVNEAGDCWIVNRCDPPIVEALMPSGSDGFVLWGTIDTRDLPVGVGVDKGTIVEPLGAVELVVQAWNNRR